MAKEEMKHISGKVTADYGMKSAEENIACIKAGEPVKLSHDKLDVLTVSGEKKEIKPEEKFGEITPVNDKAAAAMRKALRENKFDLYVDPDSSVRFAGKHVPTGTVTDKSTLLLKSPASAQHIEMSGSSIVWGKGVLRESSFINASNGKDDMAIGEGYITKSVLRNHTEIGLDDNHISKSTLDNVVVGNATVDNSDIASAKATKVTKHKPMLANSHFKNAVIKTGQDSNFINSLFTNTKIDTDLANNFDKASVTDVNLTNDNDKAKDGYTVSNSYLKEVISTQPLTASDTKLGGKPWHPILNTAQADFTKSDISTDKGAVISTSGDKPIVMKEATVDEASIQHNTPNVTPGKNITGFSAIAKMDHGHYGVDKDQTISAGTLKVVKDEIEQGGHAKVATATHTKAAKPAIGPEL